MKVINRKLQLDEYNKSGNIVWKLNTISIKLWKLFIITMDQYHREEINWKLDILSRKIWKLEILENKLAHRSVL